MSAKKVTLSDEEKKLVRRYLIWCYKTTKEDYDRVERYFTQFKVDYNVLGILMKNEDIKDKERGKGYFQKVDGFAKYIEAKEKRVIPQKFIDQQKKILQPDYWYLKKRLEALEETICDFLGKQELETIKSMYEEEMTRRILDAREH